ncbi:hypothetical protein C8F01DRAFT_1107253 [Mycena amicta]|nr:hypothetical protein C8F01DRAFT_1107253 [Mycena amicta]
MDGRNVEDADMMDAPQISILREETPPAPTRRVKLLVKDTRANASTSRKRPISALTDEDEEDQLIDDDDAPFRPPPPDLPPPAAAAGAEPPAKRKAPNKRKPRKTEKKLAEEERLAAEKVMQQQSGPPSLAPSMTWFEVAPHKAHELGGQMGTLDLSTSIPPPPLSIVPLDPGPSAVLPKKKEKAPRKAPAPTRARAKPKAKAVLLPQPEDTTDVVSEAGYSVTAASSPVTAHFEGNTPEPDALTLPPPATNGVVADDPPINLQGVPLPQYPLPLKPFAVQPPPKINTGFAPTLPLDRSGAKVRHWRVVNREIRGIAGGRWCTQTWVGGKESQYALVAEKQAAVELPKLPKAAPKAKAPKNAVSSLNASTVPSRSNSAVPTKMRNTVVAAPPSDGGDSDMVAPVDA